MFAILLEDTLRLIFGFLPEAELGACSHICKRWQQTIFKLALERETEFSLFLRKVRDWVLLVMATTNGDATRLYNYCTSSLPFFRPTAIKKRLFNPIFVGLFEQDTSPKERIQMVLPRLHFLGKLLAKTILSAGSQDGNWSGRPEPIFFAHHDPRFVLVFFHLNLKPKQKNTICFIK